MAVRPGGDRCDRSVDIPTLVEFGAELEASGHRIVTTAPLMQHPYELGAMSGVGEHEEISLRIPHVPPKVPYVRERRNALVKPRRIGVIGCGRIAQIMHLPFLDELPQFSVAALADVSQDVLDELKGRYPGADCYTSYEDVLSRSDIEVVAVLTPDHAEIAEQAALAGKHIFVEKPLCFSEAEGYRIREAVKSTGVRLMVGYMRRFDPTFQHLLGKLPELGQVQFVRARDFLGLRSFPSDVYSLATDPVQSGSPLDRSLLFDRLAQALDVSDTRRAKLYLDVLMLGVHDFSVLRPLLGPPSEVIGTTLLGPRNLVTSFGYESGARAMLELGVWPLQTWVETDFEVITDEATASMSFPNPWVRYLPTTLTRRRIANGETVETRGPHTYRSMYREEWLEFDDALTAGRDPVTGVQEGIEDVALAAAIVKAIPNDELDEVLPSDAT